MTNLFEAGAAKEFSSRIDKLSPKSKALWGDMTVDQMVHHCNRFMAYARGQEEVEQRSNWIMRTIFKPLGLGRVPFPKGKADTIPEFKVHEHYDLNKEREALKDHIHWLAGAREQSVWPPHPFFGSFTGENWGRMAYKHTDHHLRQFGV